MQTVELQQGTPEWHAFRAAHFTESAAIQHGLALEAANMQAIERAKERMK